MMEAVNWAAWVAIGLGFLAHTVTIAWYLARLSTNVGNLADDVKNLKLITEAINVINERVTVLRKDHEEQKNYRLSNEAEVWRAINGIKEKMIVAR